MTIDLDKMFSKWKIITSIIGGVIVIGKFCWPIVTFVEDTYDRNQDIPKIYATLDSLRLEVYAQRLVQQGRGLEYAPHRFLDSLKKQEGR